MPWKGSHGDRDTTERVCIPHSSVLGGGEEQTQMAPKGDCFGVLDRSVPWHPKSLTVQRDVTDRKADRLNYWGNMQLHF